MLNFLETSLALIYFVTINVLYTLQKIKYFMREQNTLMSNIIMSEKLL
jgi:hypothetical protein